MNSYSWVDMRVGLSAEFEVTVSAAMIDAFRELSGDTNPLHSDSLVAQARGFPAAVAHGMLVAGFYSRLAGLYLPGEFCLLHWIEVTFSKPVYAGDCLRVRGEISHLNHACQQVEIRATIESPSGLVSRAKIRAGVHG
jgi:3-hydroxybutyryl-CoA dehydratase